MNSIQRLTHSKVILGLARVFKLTSLLRGVYFSLAAPKAGVASLSIMGVQAEIPVKTPQELRVAEGKLLWEEDFLKALIASLRPGDTFLDVGSFIGLFALTMAKVLGETGQVVAFEPADLAHDRLQESIRQAGLRNIRVFKKALGGSDARGELVTAGEESFLLRAGVLKPEAQRLPVGSQRRTVEIVTGDGIREREKLPVPRAVKIDVEGFEYDVLQGLRRTLADPSCQIVCCEVHPHALPAGVDASTLTQFLQSLGFRDIQLHPRSTMVHLVALKKNLISN